MKKGWKKVKLTEIGLLARGKSKHRPRDAAFLYGGQYPFIQTGDVKSANHKVYKYSTTYSEDGLKQSKLWPAGTLCITIAANIADTAILTFPACFPDSILGFIPDPNECDVNFMEYYLRSIKSNIKSYAIGSVQDNINLGTFDNLELTLPPLEEQRRIASILTAIDNKIELNRRMNTTLEGIAGALWEEWFGKYVREGAELPEGWTNQSMGDLIDTISKTYKFNKEEIIFLNTSDILNGVVLNNNYTSVSGLPGQAKKSIQRNDILFSEIRPANRRFAFVNFSPEDYVVSTKLMVLRSKGKVPPLFLYFFLTRQETLDHLQMLAESRSGTFPQITFDHVKSLNIPFPDDDQIERFSKLLETIYGSIFENSNQITTLTHLRDTLLPRLMRGE